MSTENAAPKQSPFMSVFGRKKRINGTKSADDIKGVAANLGVNGGQVVTNGFIDADRDSLRESTIAASPSNVVSQSNQSNVERHQQQQIQPSNSTFADKVRYYKSSRSKYARDAKNEVRQGSVPAESSTLPGRSKKDLKNRNALSAQQKSFSADAVYTVDPSYLMEALETLAEEQPIVARSIPKHAPIDTSDFAERSLDNCLFDSSVYDSMLCDSLKVCEALQNHLDACIMTVRAKSPEGRLLGCVVEEETEEESSLATNETNSQQTVVESRRRSMDAAKRISTLTNDTSVSSIDFDIRASALHPNQQLEARKLKSIVQYEC